jgi:hypothetical protein
MFAVGNILNHDHNFSLEEFAVMDVETGNPSIDKQHA